MGDLSVTTKTDREMRDYVSGEAERLGVTRAEFVRRLLDLYRESRREQVSCPHCSSTVKMDVRE
jgi:ribosomal protein L37AE/L43A